MSAEKTLSADGVAIAAKVVGLLGPLVVAAGIVGQRPAAAVPAFAQQTGQNCKACHVGGFGPQLTPFGREFKLRGYTMRTQSSIPFSAMAVASSVSTKAAQEEPPTDHSKRNNNVAFDEGSLFLAGGIGSHIGGFAQVTYDGAERAWAWDNLDLRLVNSGKVGGKELVYGISVNNNPTIQDSWNTLPGWGYPYTDSALAPGPAAAPLIDGGLGQATLGMTAYAWLDSKFYLEAGGYSTLSKGTLRWLGSDPLDPGDIHGIAPYGRVAFQTDLAGGTFEAGAFALKASIYPGRDRSTGMTDRFTDVGADVSWIRSLKSGTATFNARYVHEAQSLNATCALALEDSETGSTPLCADNHLNEKRADLSYYWHDAVGATVSAFDLSGSTNPVIYGDNRLLRPDSSGFQFQLDGTPFGSGKSPLGPRFNMRVGVQYTVYTRFDGARRDFDGTGRNASDNNTLRLFTWLAF